MAAKKRSKVTYGIKNVHIWPITETSESGKPTYGTIFDFPGATEISFDAEGSSDPLYADNTIYFQNSVNNGYSGSLTVADVVREFKKQILNETEDKNGALIENADVDTTEFAMAFEFEGDVSKRRHLFYRCKASRPGVSSQTKEDKIEANTPEISISALPRLDTGDVKASAEEADAAYSVWYGEKPYEKDSEVTESTTG